MIVHEGEGAIWGVRWNVGASADTNKGTSTSGGIGIGGRLIAWANEKGVKIYDCESRARITFIERPPRPRTRERTRTRRKSVKSKEDSISVQKSPSTSTKLPPSGSRSNRLDVPSSPKSSKPPSSPSLKPTKSFSSPKFARVSLYTTSTPAHFPASPSSPTSPSPSPSNPESDSPASSSDSSSEDESSSDDTDPPPADIYRPILHWSNPDTLIIAWADVIRVARVRVRDQSQSHSQSNQGIGKSGIGRGGSNVGTPRAGTPTHASVPMHGQTASGGSGSTQIVSPIPESATAKLQRLATNQSIPLPSHPIPHLPSNSYQQKGKGNHDNNITSSASVAAAGAGMLNALTFGLAGTNLGMNFGGSPGPGGSRSHSPALGYSQSQGGQVSQGAQGSGVQGSGTQGTQGFQGVHTNTNTNAGTKGKGKLPPLRVEITRILQLEGMIAGFVPRSIPLLSPLSSHPLPHPLPSLHAHTKEGSNGSTANSLQRTQKQEEEEQYLVLTFTPPPKRSRARRRSDSNSVVSGNSRLSGRGRGRRVPSLPVELNIITRGMSSILSFISLLIIIIDSLFLLMFSPTLSRTRSN